MYLPSIQERKNLNKGLAKNGEKVERRGAPATYVVYYGQEKQRYKYMSRLIGPRWYLKTRLTELDLISWFDYKLYKLLPDGSEIPTDFSRVELIKMILYRKKRY